MPPEAPIRHRHAALAFALFLFAACALAADQPVPRLEARVTDVAKVLSDADRKRLSGMLTSYERETSHQIAVLLVPGLSGESIESFSLRVLNAWKLGQQRGLDNGILVALAMEEKLIRIELGAGMKKYISSAAAQSIIHDSMLPAFRKDDFAGGLHAGLQELMKQGRKFVVSPAERKPAPKK